MIDAALWLDVAKWGSGALMGAAGIATAMWRWQRGVISAAEARGAADEKKAARDKSIDDTLDELRAQMAAVIHRLAEQDRFLEWVGTMVRRPGSDPPPRLATLEDPWPEVEAQAEAHVRALRTTPAQPIKLTDLYRSTK